MPKLTKEQILQSLEDFDMETLWEIQDKANRIWNEKNLKYLRGWKYEVRS